MFVRLSVNKCHCEERTMDGVFDMNVWKFIISYMYLDIDLYKCFHLCGIIARIIVGIHTNAITK